jgi:hypothetical protein
MSDEGSSELRVRLQQQLYLLNAVYLTRVKLVSWPRQRQFSARMHRLCSYSL